VPASATAVVSRAGMKSNSHTDTADSQSANYSTVTGSAARRRVSLSNLWDPGISPRGDQREKVYTCEKHKTRQGRPFQSACGGWSVPTKKCGDFPVNVSLSSTCSLAGRKLVQKGMYPGVSWRRLSPSRHFCSCTIHLGLPHLDMLAPPQASRTSFQSEVQMI